jgi:acetyl esterase/lipase
MGFVFISVNYPMLPETDVAGQVAEVGKALQFAQQNAGKWGGDRNEFILMGHSAGAHIVSMLSAQNVATIRGTVSLDSGALDVAQIMKLPHLRLYDDAFGTDPAYWAAMSPTRQLKAGGAPWLGVCSSSRKISCPQNQAYAKRAGELGIRAAVLPIEKSHGEINADLGADAAYTKDVESFMATLSPAFAARFTSDAPFAAGDEKDAPKRGILRERLRERLTGRTQ